VTERVRMTAPATLNLGPELEAIRADWVLSGQPKSRHKVVATSGDRNSYLVVWECTAGRFNWHYRQDESVVVICGEAFMLDEQGNERRFGAGDVGFFPAGTSCTWRVPSGFRKVALVRQTMWRPLGFVLNAWRRILKTISRPDSVTATPAREFRMSVQWV
jgi:uncharacterized protein